ncbi:hypothetical protein CCR94_12105 [Rhodoblastus sphagnicola]|uniref:Uncharacterized protein n=1 Tax=Rhodoblastus sphagnicola TaxID=333368 RepID=A0A2S6N7M8_9HYPH|nr:hypothetical protein [Rhodoblastus sphagnicola]MBB4196699.1 hypothetical protein [Rhodoblastus sphagnicola]PPQ30625.1 hypothetical protein CCR94_12105 [Rhodoblastus sphagnicola]
MKPDLFALVPLVIVSFGLAAAAPAATPAPPARPPEFGKAAAPSATTPEACAPNCPNAGAATGRQPVDVDVGSLQPYNLPPASRERMRACGEDWRARKLAGQATGLTWRSFAEKCLVQ